MRVEYNSCVAAMPIAHSKGYKNVLEGAACCAYAICISYPYVHWYNLHWWHFRIEIALESILECLCASKCLSSWLSNQYSVFEECVSEACNICRYVHTYNVYIQFRLVYENVNPLECLRNSNVVGLDEMHNYLLPTYLYVNKMKIKIQDSLNVFTIVWRCFYYAIIQYIM